MSERTDKILALVTLADIRYSESYKLPNGYDSQRTDPWMLFVCSAGTFTIGWRKRVLSVSWTIGDANPIEEEDLQWVSHDKDFFHAWNWPQALLFLTRVAKQLGCTHEAAMKEAPHGSE